MAKPRWVLIKPDGLRLKCGKARAIRAAQGLSRREPGRWAVEGDGRRYVYEGGELLPRTSMSLADCLATLGRELGPMLAEDLAEGAIDHAALHSLRR